MNTLNPANLDHRTADFRSNSADCAVATESADVVSDARSVLFATLGALGLTILGIVLAA